MGITHSCDVRVPNDRYLVKYEASGCDVVIVNWYHGDWQAAYVNGKLFRETHDLYWWDFKAIIDKHGPIKSITGRWFTEAADNKYSSVIPSKLSEYSEDDFSKS